MSFSRHRPPSGMMTCFIADCGGLGCGCVRWLVLWRVLCLCPSPYIFLFCRPCPLVAYYLHFLPAVGLGGEGLIYHINLHAVRIPAWNTRSIRGVYTCFISPQILDCNGVCGGSNSFVSDLYFLYVPMFALPTNYVIGPSLYFSIVYVRLKLACDYGY